MQNCRYVTMEKATAGAHYPHFLVSKRDTQKWDREIGNAQMVLGKLGKDRARLLISFIMNAFLFFTHPNAYDTKTYHPLREEVLMQILLYPGESVFSLARHVCEERGGKSVDPKEVAEIHREILNGRLLPKSPLCFHRKCIDEPRQPIRIYPTLFLAKHVQDIARGGMPVEQIIECARITEAGRVLLVMDSDGLYPNIWHYPCELIGENDKKEGDALQRAAERLFGASLRMEGVSYERPSMKRLELGELIWLQVFEVSLLEKLRFLKPEKSYKWWTAEQIQNDQEKDGKHEIEDLHGSIELRIRSLQGTRIESWKNRGKMLI